MLDFFFYNTNIVRFILFLKKSEKKYYYEKIINLNEICVYFNIKNITDLNNLSFSNYYFFFKYFFGKIPYLSNYKYNFKLNVNYYNFLILYSFKKKDLFFIFSFFLNDIYYLISKNAIKIKKELNYWEYIITDMNFFIEKKNSIGFFYLKDHIHFKFLFNNIEWIHCFNFFKLYKL